jgi:hypothetical protein
MKQWVVSLAVLCLGNGTISASLIASLRYNSGLQQLETVVTTGQGNDDGLAASGAIRTISQPATIVTSTT